MKKKFVLGFLTVSILAVSSLVHAAAEPQKTTGCVTLAHAILARPLEHFPRATSKHIQQNENQEDDLNCENSFPFRTWAVRRKLAREQEAIGNDTKQLEQCIQQSPGEAQNPIVIEARNTLSQRNNLNRNEFTQLSQCHEKSREFMSKAAFVLFLWAL